MRRLIAFILVVSVSIGSMGYWWVHQPLWQGDTALEFEVAPGSSPRAVAQKVKDAGAQVNVDLLYFWFRLSGQDRSIKAGNYEITAGTTPQTLLRKLVQGEQALKSIAFVEGWTFRQMRLAIEREPQLKHDSKGLTDQELMAKLGRPGLHPEGRFFPDTYTYAKGASDLTVLARALQAMDQRLEAAWELRESDSPLKSPEEALILASIIEKETGQAADRARIAGVFTNRMRLGMLLQTDPTVIYGLGERFDGNLRRRDLQTDTPWNTYTRPGLPPTPIAMPGKASLIAAVQPLRTKDLYFVAKGDGASHFSESLDEHNRAVNQYQRRR